MARTSNFEIAKDKIKFFFDQSPTRIFTAAELAGIFDSNRDRWKLSKTMTTTQFFDALVNHVDFANVNLNFRNLSINSYFYKETSKISIVSKFTKKTYLSHYSSVSLHNLSEQIPKVIYVTRELSEKFDRKPLTISQDSIDAAFSKRQRESSNEEHIMDTKVVLLERKYSNNLGVITDFDPASKEEIRFTDLERTLIDITVRPNYAGGPFEVLKAYQEALDKVSINRLTAMLNKLDYIYPYHQAIGFYLERAGFSNDSLLQFLKRLGMKYDFYLTYNIEDKVYDDKWQIYYPRGL